jgi:hypothetical protein
MPRGIEKKNNAKLKAVILNKFLVVYPIGNEYKKEHGSVFIWAIA